MPIMTSVGRLAAAASLRRRATPPGTPSPPRARAARDTSRSGRWVSCSEIPCSQTGRWSRARKPARPLGLVCATWVTIRSMTSRREDMVSSSGVWLGTRQLWFAPWRATNCRGRQRDGEQQRSDQAHDIGGDSERRRRVSACGSRIADSATALLRSARRPQQAAAAGPPQLSPRAPRRRGAGRTRSQWWRGTRTRWRPSASSTTTARGADRRCQAGRRTPAQATGSTRLPDPGTPAADRSGRSELEQRHRKAQHQWRDDDPPSRIVTSPWGSVMPWAGYTAAMTAARAKGRTSHRPNAGPWWGAQSGRAHRQCPIQRSSSMPSQCSHPIPAPHPSSHPMVRLGSSGNWWGVR